MSIAKYVDQARKFIIQHFLFFSQLILWIVCYLIMKILEYFINKSKKDKEKKRGDSVDSQNKIIESEFVNNKSEELIYHETNEFSDSMNKIIEPKYIKKINLEDDEEKENN